MRIFCRSRAARGHEEEEPGTCQKDHDDRSTDNNEELVYALLGRHFTANFRFRRHRIPARDSLATRRFRPHVHL